MQFLYIHEVLRLLLNQSNKNPETFISIFNQSDSLIAFNYSSVENRFTHISKSFSEILGYNQNNILIKDKFVSKIIHSQDKELFYAFFNSSLTENGMVHNSIKRLKFRARHIKGYWKYFMLFSMNYWNTKMDRFEKVGLMIDEHVKPQYQTLFKHIDGFTWENITSENNTFVSQSAHIQISPRESEILELISNGQIAKEIARELNISPNTVITHRKNLICKLQVRNTAQLIKKASQLMLI